MHVRLLHHGCYHTNILHNQLCCKRNSVVQEAVLLVADMSGVGGCKDVLPIKNFCDESEPTTEAGILVYRALQEALYAAIDHLRRSPEMLNPNQRDAEIC
jgi:hypothetical protein